MSEDPQSIHYLSSNVLSIAQAIDMLPAGEYQLQLVKPEVRGCAWDVKIERRELIQSLRLSRSEHQITEV